MFRRTAIGTNGISETKNETNDTKETIALSLIRENPAITQKEIKEKMGISLVTVKRLMANLQKSGRIQRKGGGGTKGLSVAELNQYQIIENLNGEFTDEARKIVFGYEDKTAGNPN